MSTDVDGIDIDAAIEEMVRRLVERFDPLQVVLFGSHARGEARPESDVDLLLVMPEARREEARGGEALGTVSGCGVPADVLVRTPEEVWREGRLPGSVLRHALQEGRVVYERDDRPDEARRLLSMAREDLRSAEVIEAEGIHRNACFLAQQAAEKAIKAALVMADVDYPRIHDLDDLLALLPDGWPLRDEYSDLQWLTRWAVDVRYAGNGEAEERVVEGIETARAILDSVVRDLRAHGLEVEGGGATRG